MRSLTAVKSVRLSAVAATHTFERVGTRSLATASGITPHSGKAANHAHRERLGPLRFLRIAFMRMAVSSAPYN